MTRRVVTAFDLALGRALAVELATQELPYPLLQADSTLSSSSSRMNGVQYGSLCRSRTVRAIHWVPACYLLSLPRRCSVGASPVHLLNAFVKALGS
jgi:hypothetical protein